MNEEIYLYEPVSIARKLGAFAERLPDAAQEAAGDALVLAWRVLLARDPAARARELRDFRATVRETRRQAPNDRVTDAFCRAITFYMRDRELDAARALRPHLTGHAANDIGHALRDGLIRNGRMGAVAAAVAGTS